MTKFKDIKNGATVAGVVPNQPDEDEGGERSSEE